MRHRLVNIFALFLASFLVAFLARADGTDLRRSDLPTLRAHDATVVSFIRSADSVFVSLSRNQGSIKNYQIKIGKRMRVDDAGKAALSALFASSANFVRRDGVPEANATGALTKAERDQALRDLENYVAGTKPVTGNDDDYTPPSRESVGLIWVKGDEFLSITIDRFGLEGRFAWADGHQGREISDEFSPAGEKAFGKWSNDHPAKPIGPDAEIIGPGAPKSH
jgi:hypothetical protein